MDVKNALITFVKTRVNRDNPLCPMMIDDHPIQHLDSEELNEIIQELRERALSHPILVEGLKDREALQALGVHGHIMHINLGKPLIDFCSDISLEFRKVTILTDWDSKGNTLCMILKKDLKACDVSFDARLRGRLAALLRKDVKDVESIPAFLRKTHQDVLEHIL